MNKKSIELFLETLLSGSTYIRQQLRSARIILQSALRFLFNRQSPTIFLNRKSNHVAIYGGWPFDLAAPDI